MNIAICSQSGEKADQCFGYSLKFYIYKVKDNTLNFVDMRMVEPYFNTPDAFLSFNHTRFSNVYEAIEDCCQVYCMAIDKVVRERLEERQIEIHISTQPLKEIFNNLITQRRKLS